MLAFFEFPSSLSWSSDISSRGDRIHFPCGVTESIEFICLLLLIADAYIKVGELLHNILTPLTLLHSERLKLHRVLAILSAIELNSLGS